MVGAIRSGEATKPSGVRATGSRKFPSGPAGPPRKPVSQHPRVDGAGGVAPYAARSQFKGGRPREGAKRALGHGVDGGVRRRRDRVHGPDVDDRAVRRGQKSPRLPNALKGAAEVDVHQPFPVVAGRVAQRFVEPDGGVVHESRQRAFFPGPPAVQKTAPATRIWPLDSMRASPIIVNGSDAWCTARPPRNEKCEGSGSGPLCRQGRRSRHGSTVTAAAAASKSSKGLIHGPGVRPS